MYFCAFLFSCCLLRCINTMWSLHSFDGPPPHAWCMGWCHHPSFWNRLKCQSTTLCPPRVIGGEAEVVTIWLGDFWVTRLILVTLYTLLSLTGRKEHTISKKDRFNNDFRMAYHTPYTKTGNMDFFLQW